jgi:hypothetical protein
VVPFQNLVNSLNTAADPVVLGFQLRQGQRRKFGREPSKEYHIEFGPVVVQRNIKL